MDTYDFRGAYKPTGGRVGVRTGGAGRKRCTKGKSCGATCISAKKECWVDLPGGKPGSNDGRNLHDSTSKARDLIKARTGKGGSVTPQPQPQTTPQPKPQPTPQPKPQPQPQTRTEAQEAASRAKQQRQKEREAKSFEKAKSGVGRDLDAAVAKTKKKPAENQPLSQSEIRKREKLEQSGEAQKIMNKRQDAAKLDFSSPEAKSIRTYTSDRDIRGINQYQNLNNCLRNPGACKNAEEAKKLQEGLDNALRSLPKNTDNFEFRRAIPISKETAELYDFLKNAKAGTVLQDRGYGSFTSDKEHAAGLADPRFGKTIQLVTRSGQIVPVNQYSNIKDEAEGILPRGASLKITKVVETESGLVAYLED
jgi:hypothetical protein